MAITKVDEREYPVSVTIAFDFDDIATAVGTHAAAGVCNVPDGAMITGGEVIVDTAWDNTTATLDVGDGDDGDRYTSSVVDLTTAGRTALTLTGYKYTAADGIDLELIIATDVPAAGAARLRLEYVVEDRAHEVQE